MRLSKDEDLRRALEAAIATRSCRAAFVVSGIGSLCGANLRFAGAAQPDALNRDLEILTLAGTIAENGSHLHMSVADAQGHVVGGHVGYGCIVRTVFAYFLNNHHGDGIVSVRCKTELGQNVDRTLREPDRFYIPAYIGPRGWVGVRLDVLPVDWDEVVAIVKSSHRLAAPRKLAKLLDSEV